MISTTTMRRALVGAAVAGTLAVAVAPAATAAPASPAPAPSSTQKVGDGVWAPSHDEALAILPVCSGPTATLSWLNKNFTDHGRDIRLFADANTAVLGSILRFAPDPYAVLQVAFRDVAQLPVYAINDVVFHQTATIADILQFCKSARS